MIVGHRDGIFIAKKIRRMKHENVQGVTLNPLSAVKQAPQGAHPGVNFDAERLFQCMYCAHLICNGTDSADPGDYIGNLVEVSSSQKGLEEPRRLVYFQLYICDALPS